MTAPAFAHHRRHLTAIIDAALAAAAPAPALVAAIHREATPPSPNAAVLAVGKAALPMMRASFDHLGLRPTHALAIHPPCIPDLALSAYPQLTLIASDHPLPTQRSLAAGQAALDFASECSREGRPLVVLLSGGASSLMCLPHPGLTIDDLRACMQDLLRAGASIQQINAVRSQCDQVKAGGLALAAAPSPLHTFIISDVIGNHLPSIGSGPTVVPESTPREAFDILTHFKLDRKHKPIAAHLRLQAVSHHAPVQTDFAHTSTTIISDNAAAVTAAAAKAREIGFSVAPTRADVIGESRDAAFDFVSALRRARAKSTSQPAAVIWGGETVVTVTGKGVGGRNQEAALAAAIAIDNDVSLVVATFATDGIDGSTDAAGAIVTGHTASEARQAGVDPEDALRDNDSHTFFTRRGEHLKPGPTCTNVNDLWIGLAY